MAVDKRVYRRYSLKIPLASKALTPANGGVETTNVSARGVFFLSSTKPDEGAPVEFSLTLSPEITLTDNIVIRCKGRVVRVTQTPGSDKVGIAAIIEKYDFETKQ
jgi:PilZ domain-containing protein